MSVKLRIESTVHDRCDGLYWSQTCDFLVSERQQPSVFTWKMSFSVIQLISFKDTESYTHSQTHRPSYYKGFIWKKCPECEGSSKTLGGSVTDSCCLLFSLLSLYLAVVAMHVYWAGARWLASLHIVHRRPWHDINTAVSAHSLLMMFIFEHVHKILSISNKLLLLMEPILFQMSPLKMFKEIS